MWMLILTSMALGFGLGWTLRRHRLSLDGLTGPLVWLLLFLLGAEVGANDDLVAALPQLGGWAALLALGDGLVADPLGRDEERGRPCAVA